MEGRIPRLTSAVNCVDARLAGDRPGLLLAEPDSTPGMISNTTWKIARRPGPGPPHSGGPLRIKQGMLEIRTT